MRARLSHRLNVLTTTETVVTVPIPPTPLTAGVACETSFPEDLEEASLEVRTASSPAGGGPPHRATPAPTCRRRSRGRTSSCPARPAARCAAPTPCRSRRARSPVSPAGEHGPEPAHDVGDVPGVRADDIAPGAHRLDHGNTDSPRGGTASRRRRRCGTDRRRPRRRRPGRPAADPRGTARASSMATMTSGWEKRTLPASVRCTSGSVAHTCSMASSRSLIPLAATNLPT